MQSPFRSHFPELRKEIDLQLDSHSTGDQYISQFNFNNPNKERNNDREHPYNMKMSRSLGRPSNF